MNIFVDFFQYISSADTFAKVVLLLLLIFYSLFALVLAFQVFTFNRLMVQKPFAPIFQMIAILHAVFSFILLLLVVLSL